MEIFTFFKRRKPKAFGRGINLLGTTECTIGDTIRKKTKKKKKRLPYGRPFIIARG